MAEKTFVLGMGAQKAGTSWLHAYLSAAPTANMGFTKEYHVWDRLRLPLAADAKVRLSPRVLFHRRLLGMAILQRWPGLYFPYFQSLLRGRASLTGDITPAYAGLAAADVREIVAGFADRGIGVKIVFLMRDPVDRCWSAARMKARRKRPQQGDAAAAAVLQAWYARPQTQLRTRYEQVLATISASGVAPENVHLGLFEEMFTPREIGRLSDFLGIPADPSFGDRGVFVNPSRSSPPTALAREVAAFYRETYAAVGRRLPRARDAWPGFGLLHDDEGRAPGVRRLAA